MKKAKVYFTKEVSKEAIVKMYKILAHPLRGKVGIKISTGEPGGNNYLHPEILADICQELDGTIVECCTAYGGRREDPKDHWEAIKEHNFESVAKVDLMDEDGEIEIPLKNTYHLDKNIVGKNIDNYDSFLILSHFKGHVMAGMGGAMKNIAIGMASTRGKAYIHSAGKSTSSKECWNLDTKQDDFLESMADACYGVRNYVGAKNMLYINVAYRLSVDCDCDAHPAEPKMADIGIFASSDMVAIDKACYDAVMNSNDPGKGDLIERMTSRHAIHIVEASEKLGLGTSEYEIINID